MRKAIVGAGIGISLALACGAFLLGSTQGTIVGRDDRSPVSTEPNDVTASPSASPARDDGGSSEPSTHRRRSAPFEDDARRPSPPPSPPSRVLPALPNEEEEPRYPGAPSAQTGALRAPSKTLPAAVTQE